MQFITQSSDTDTQHFGGMGAVAGGLIQGLGDEVLFHLL